MSAATVQCPQCFHRLPAPTEPTDKLKCPSCESEFSAEVEPPPRKNPAVPLARALPRDGSAPAPIPDARPAEPTRATAAQRTDEGSRPRSRRRDDDEEDARPRSRRRRYDDDRPAKKRGGSALPVILIVGGVLIVLTLGGAAALALAVAWSAPVANATKPYTQIPPPQVVEPDWVGPNGPNGAGRLVGPGGDFPQGQGGGPVGEFPPPVEPWNPQPDKPKVPKQAPKYAEIVPQEIKPAKLSGDTVDVALPGKVSDTCSGGGGRFFIALLSDKRQLAIFDVNEAKVKYIALAGDKVKFAAGMNKLIVAYPDQNTFTRYDLTTFEKEATVKSPLGGTIEHLCMGSASAGPLLVGVTGRQGRLFGGDITFLDPVTFKEVDIAIEQREMGGNVMHFRAAPDGSVFTSWCTSHVPQGLNSIVVKGGAAKGYYEHDSVGHLVPGPDSNLYTGRELYTSQLKKLSKEPARMSEVLLPAAEGHFYLRLSGGDGDRAHFPGGAPGDGQQLKLEVRMVGDERTVHTFKGLPSLGNDAWTAIDFTYDKRVHFAPTAKLLVTIPNTNDKLVLHRFDMEAAFEASGIDYLYVTSRPPTAVPGKGYEYQIAVKSKKGGVKCKLDAGPNGLKVSDTGKVTWATPGDFTAPESVIITVSDGSGQEIFHTFELAPGDGKGFAGPITGGGKITPRVDNAPDPKGGTGLVLAPDRVFELKPPPLQERAVVSLPGPADAVCAGGGGRFLIYRLSSKKQLAVLDVTVGKVVKYIPLAESDALFTAGMTKLFVFNKTAGVFLRYDLEKLEKDLTAQNPLGGNPSLLRMGHSSEGPLYLGGPDVGTDTKGYGFINPRTMKEVKVPLEWAPGQVNGNAPHAPTAYSDINRREWTVLQMSPDGRTIAWMDHGGGSKRLVIGDKSAKSYQEGRGEYGTLVPGPDGHLFGANGVYQLDLKSKDRDGRQGPWGAFAPATSGPWYVAVVEGVHNNSNRNQRKIFLASTIDDRLRIPLTGLGGVPPTLDYSAELRSGETGKMSLAARLHLVPEAEVLAVLDEGLEKVHLHRVRVKTLLDKTDIDYMLVVSRPPSAVRGQKWAYTPDVWSKKGGVKVKVESGPDGMKATGGTVRWDVPAKFAENDPTIILTISDASGQEAFHTFTLSVRAEGLPAATVIRPAAPPVVDPGKAVDPSKGSGKPASAFPLKPTAAKDGTDVDLPAAADDACLAGGGRFILFRIPSKKLVAVFDVVDGKVVKELAMPEDGALVAGSRSFAYLVNPKAGLVQRWNLSTFEKEATTKLSDGFAPQVAVMGHASEGPLYLGSGKGFHPAVKTSNGFYDPLTLTKLEYKSAEPDKPLSLPEESNSDTVHASPDGRVFAWWQRDSIPNGVSTFSISDRNVARFRYAHTSAAALMVGADGDVFTACGVFSPDFKTIHDSQPDGVRLHQAFGIQTGELPGQYGRTAVPAADGPWYLWFPPTKKDNTDPGGPPTVKMLGMKEPLGELKGVRGLDDPKENRPNTPPKGDYLQPNQSVFPYYQRTFLIPGAELLAVLSPDGKKIHIHSFKAREMLDKSGQDYLMVMGRPPQFAPPGTKWTYTPDVWSKKGGVKVEVVSGPPGLKADGATVNWDVSKDLLDNQVTVELMVSDSSGKSVPHKFNLSLNDTAPSPISTPFGGPVGTTSKKDEPANPTPADRGLKKDGPSRAIPPQKPRIPQAKEVEPEVKDPDPNGNALVVKHKEKLTTKATSEWADWPVSKLFDGDAKTSWYSNQPDNTTTDQKPVVTVTFPEDVKIKRVTILGNRDPQYPNGYAVSEGTLEFVGGDGKAISKHELKATGQKSDFDLKLDKPVTARTVRFTMTKSENGSCGLGEFQVE